MHDLPSFEDATRAYEAWVRRFTAIVSADLQLKHEQMRADSFRFLRATFYRWQQLCPTLCAHALKGPMVLAVADLHLDNFGTWRDLEGRLAWGVNDFDEAAALPYANDLIRLATSAFLAIDNDHLKLTHAEAIDALLEGYAAELGGGESPFILEGDHPALRRLALVALHEPKEFWDRLSSGRRVAGKLPRGARKALMSLLPDGATKVTVRRRVAGMGSLGRPRFVALAEWEGARIAREAKARVPSACVWAGALEANAHREILKRSVRPRDPYLQVRRRWVVRRLAPDCGRIELTRIPADRDERRLLRAMGRETANIHLGSAKATALSRHLAKQPDQWLEHAARTMAHATLDDWNSWRHRAVGE